ncbi:TetR/AcrR family transcriptional regulator [Paenibacillus methanolicus]|uniref:AcrR family transcriptional regulator n=1 Tax=Paenibacillus methanolicus TaxID=582686 RepID=A0A5S5CAS2_9BACL|nr:TetR/AcrR family transcriptional regulator [Paenibacillus methanolicus]TYP75602.1 AcrR family transcriptional regulator [Paenibacillus methanolicus]
MTANRIKQAAMTLFTESGYEGASLSEIAKLVGIKTPSIYAHFDSKEQLFLSLLTDVIEEERSRFSALLADTEEAAPMDRVRAAFGFFSDADATKALSFLKRAIIVPPRHLRDRIRSDFAAYERFLDERLGPLFQACFRDGAEATRDVRPLTALFYGLVDGLIVEQEAYEEAVYRERQQMLWEWFRGALAGER